MAKMIAVVVGLSFLFLSVSFADDLNREIVMKMINKQSLSESEFDEYVSKRALYNKEIIKWKNARSENDNSDDKKDDDNSGMENQSVDNTTPDVGVSSISLIPPIEPIK